MARLCAAVTSIFCLLSMTAATPSADLLSGSTTLNTTTSVPITNPNARNIIPNSYIVVYNSAHDDAKIKAHQKLWISKIAKRNLGVKRRRSLATRTTNAMNMPIGGGSKFLSAAVHTFNKIGNMRAMALDADDNTIKEINSADEVAYVEANTLVYASNLTFRDDAPSGLVRLSRQNAEKARETDMYLYDDSAGEGITIFVVDTGIKTSHQEFEGRAFFAANFANTVNDDENGHGSHVAGTIGGKTYGVANKVTLQAVKVLDATGGGSVTNVIAGMNFVAQSAINGSLAGKAVLNMSLGGSKSNAMNAALGAIRAAGVVPVVAAGNDGEDASNDSPASAAGAITVGAIDQTTDEKADFSNYGEFVNVFAPGVNVLSVGIKNDTDSAVLSGTSMASPHVAGLAAYLMAKEGLTDVDEIEDRITNLANDTGSSVLANELLTTPLIANNGFL